MTSASWRRHLRWVTIVAADVARIARRFCRRSISLLNAVVDIRPVDWGTRRARRLRQRLQARSGGRTLVADSEAFLSGHFAERMGARSATVPVWAWTNLLAHGAEGELRRTARTLPRPRAHDSIWEKARAYLADDILQMVGHDVSLAEVQRQVLVPLELELAALSDADSWQPQDLVVAVDAALEAHHRSRRP
jgi:hypothetical protein